MKGKFEKGGLIKKKDDNVPVLMSPGVTCVPKAAVEGYGVEPIQKINGGLESNNLKDLVLLFPGVSYVSRAIFEKYGAEFLRKISGVEKIIVIETEKSS